MSGQRLIVGLSGRRVALDLAVIEAIADCPTITELPRLPAAIRGVAEVRGRVIPIIDLDAPAPRQAGEHRALVVVSDGRRRFGLLFDGVENIDESDTDAPSLDVTRVLADIR